MALVYTHPGLNTEEELWLPLRNSFSYSFTLVNRFHQTNFHYFGDLSVSMTVLETIKGSFTFTGLSPYQNSKSGQSVPKEIRVFRKIEWGKYHPELTNAEDVV